MAGRVRNGAEVQPTFGVQLYYDPPPRPLTVGQQARTLPVKENQPALPRWQRREWRERGATLTVRVDAWPKQRHGRWERRELWALADPELNGYVGSTGTVGEGWPHCNRYAGWSGGGQ